MAYNKIDQLLKRQSRVVIAIDGMAASGKSTLAEELRDHYDATVFHMDDYFLPLAKKTKKRLAMIGGNVNFELMRDEIHEKIKEDKIEHSKFNCKNNKLSKVDVELKQLVIVEGVYSFREELISYYDFLIYVEVDKEVQLDRLRNRDNKLFEKFVNEWLPLERKYFATNIKAKADVILKVK